MDLFQGQNLLEFADRFKSDEDCMEYPAHFKWKDGFVCTKCGHTGCQSRKNHSRTCNKCSHTESATANTLFHKVKFGVRKAFFICFEMATTTKSLSASYVAERFSLTEKTLGAVHVGNHKMVIFPKEALQLIKKYFKV